MKLAGFLTRAEYDANHKALEARLEAAVAALGARIQSVESAVASMHAERKGIERTGRYVVAAAGLFLTVATIIITFTR